MNLPFKKIVDKQLLELAGLNPEQVKEVEVYEEQVAGPMQQLMAQAGAGQAGAAPSSQQALPASTSQTPMAQ